jgi:hypothetical protein
MEYNITLVRDEPEGSDGDREAGAGVREEESRW